MTTQYEIPIKYTSKNEIPIKTMSKQGDKELPLLIIYSNICYHKVIVNLP